MTPTRRQQLEARRAALKAERDRDLPMKSFPVEIRRAAHTAVFGDDVGTRSRMMSIRIR